ncbi:hypothetical protein JTE90_026885 [Oedothorax gibbosus]|uniref:Uncharacterized protein n=1 Tax=Oedothorax gibbosus TaxID=931172 RepID=A0AAV6TPD7_9ARAC|nr:hypothetical protein JTE90_026885 [Oedothorax gibbosus]
MDSAKPQRKAKSMTKEQKLEKAEREKRLSTTNERILGMKRDVLKTVESMLLKDLSIEWFLENCSKLCQQDYEDVIQESYFDVLPLFGLHYRDIRDGVKKIVETFSLTLTNITFKPPEWKCISLVLLRILTQNVLNDIEDAKYLKKFSKISVQEINKLATDLVSSKVLCRLQSCNK